MTEIVPSGFSSTWNATTGSPSAISNRTRYSSLSHFLQNATNSANVVNVTISVSSPLNRQAIRRKDSLESARHCAWFSSRNQVSILFGQKNRGDRAVRLRNQPKLFVCVCSVAAEEPIATLQADLVFLTVFFRELAPLARNMAREKLLRLLSCFLKCGQCAGCGHNLSERKQRLVFGLLH